MAKVDSPRRRFRTPLRRSKESGRDSGGRYSADNATGAYTLARQPIILPENLAREPARRVYLVFGRFDFRVGVLTYRPLGTAFGIGGGSIWALHLLN